jgi:hypothetical protein
MTLMLLTFVITTVIYSSIFVFALRRVTSHLRGNAEAVQAVTEHVLVPLFGKKKDDADKKKPVSRESRLC